MLSDDASNGLVQEYFKSRHDIRIFMNTVADYIVEHPHLTAKSPPVIHSFKKRLKDEQHLREKILRKNSSGRLIDRENFFDEITDLAGVRVLHLYRDDFSSIDQVIRQKIADGDWYLSERAKAYSWDTETVEYFSGFYLDVSEKPTSYTSVHYLIKPRADSKICCELQVRTLFEEIWAKSIIKSITQLQAKALPVGNSLRFYQK